MIQMWNVFDFSFIVIFLVYLVLRLKGLNDNNGKYRYMPGTTWEEPLFILSS